MRKGHKGHKPHKNHPWRKGMEGMSKPVVRQNSPLYKLAGVYQTINKTKFDHNFGTQY